jgi:flavin-dependent dehydrogenase
VIDLLVIGGGLAGLSAAARAAQDGASVVVVEKGPRLGGSAVYAGFLCAAGTPRPSRAARTACRVDQPLSLG